MAGSSSSNYLKLLRPGNKGMTFIICFFLAAGIWLLNTLSKNYTAVFSIRLTQPGWKASEEESIIQATVNAQGFDLFKLHYRFAGLHNFPAMKSNNASAKSVVENLLGNLKTKAEIIAVSPEIITVADSGLPLKKVPVRSQLNFSFQQQTTAAGAVLFKPDSVEISGTAEALANINFINTLPLNFLNIDKSLFCSVGLETPAANNIFLTRDRVWMYLPVEKYTEGSVEIPLKIIYKGTSHIKLLPEKVTITYRVPLSLFNKVKPHQFKAGVYLSGLSKEDKVPVSLLEKPAFIKKVAFSPSEVTYLIFD